MTRCVLGGDRGFTLIELMMSIVLMGIVASTIGFIIYQGARSFQVLDTRSDLVAKGTLAMERISRELRLIKCTTAGNVCAPQATDITAITSTEIRFVNTSYAGRGFRLDAGAIKLRQGSTATDPEDILADNASSLLLEYKKKDGSTALPPSDIWMIDVSFTLSSGADSVDFKTSIHPRSFR
ncbi:MAG: prepilin-type N-terminal cleavage/methylation domain-containing protein [Deltaproteobacteria bacterium]|nr:prepilin-type N-terminal cleavage/methylation domain-containing protein [Deltaproteobacteria bacterium]